MPGFTLGARDATDMHARSSMLRSLDFTIKAMGIFEGLGE